MLIADNAIDESSLVRNIQDNDSNDNNEDKNYYFE